MGMPEKRRWLLAWGVLLCGGVMMFAGGLWGQEASIVLRKAIYICLECIGIG